MISFRKLDEFLYDNVIDFHIYLSLQQYLLIYDIINLTLSTKGIY